MKRRIVRKLARKREWVVGTGRIRYSRLFKIDWNTPDDKKVSLIREMEFSYPHKGRTVTYWEPEEKGGFRDVRFVFEGSMA